MSPGAEAQPIHKSGSAPRSGALPVGGGSGGSFTATGSLLSSSPTAGSGDSAPSSPVARRGRRGSTLAHGASPHVPRGSGSSGHASPAGSGPAAAAAPPAWRECLLALLQALGDAGAATTCPIGQYWLLDAAAPAARREGGAASGAANSGVAAAVGQLVGVAHPRVLKSSSDWLAPGGGPQLFSRWEVGLEEMEKLLMDAFAWVTFATAVPAGAAGSVDRRTLVLESPSLKLY